MIEFLIESVATMGQLSLIERAKSHGSAIAVRNGSEEYSYDDLLARSESIASVLLGNLDDLEEARIAYLLPAGPNYIAVQWGIWRAGGIAVPLSLSATERELEYTLSDSQTYCVVVSRDLADQVKTLCTRLGLRFVIEEAIGDPPLTTLPEVDSLRRAMILYTSGTTSKPKGVVTTHANVQAQIETLVEAWQWQAEDSIPLFLPLHHIHGIINVMSCALWSGATIEPYPRFDLVALLERVADGAYSVFMAVPTIYVKLIQAIEAAPQENRELILEGFAKMRLMVSGSAALPASVHQQWTSLTGQRLLERYGMTEIGMALSNPFDGERRAGAVGFPLPGVEVRLQSEQGEVVTGENEPGEIQVRGRSVFSEYWNRPLVTDESFAEGWFLSGDIGIVEGGYYRILGRSSVDIIKSGGYKLSALEIESALLDHPAICECAIVGLPDATWGEVVAAAIVLHQEKELSLEQLRSWCKDRISHYKIPKQLCRVEQLPRNAMGKVTKPAVKELFSS